MKVTEVSLKNVSQKQSFKSSKNKELSSFGVDNPTVSEPITKESSEAIKNNFVANISFKGYTTTVTKRCSTGGGHFYPNDLLIKRNQHFETISPVWSGSWIGEIKANLYIADPMEEVTDDIKSRHNYIIYEDEVYAGINYVKNLYRSGYHNFKSGAEDEIEYFTKLKNGAQNRLEDAKRNIKEYERKYKHAVSEREFQEEFNEPEENKNVARYYAAQNKEKRDYYRSKAQEYQRQIDYANKHLNISNEKLELFKKMDQACWDKSLVEKKNVDAIANKKWLEYHIKSSEEHLATYGEDIASIQKLIESDKKRLSETWYSESYPNIAEASVQNNMDSLVQRLDQMKNEYRELQGMLDDYKKRFDENEKTIKECMTKYPILDARLDSIMRDIEEFYKRVENNG